MITKEQCRAARGLLDWTQQDLADAATLSKTAINNFERGVKDVRGESLEAIQARSKAGISNSSEITASINGAIPSRSSMVTMRRRA